MAKSDDRFAAKIVVVVHIIHGLTVILGIAASAIPLYFLRDMCRAVAGRSTTVSLGLNIGITVAGLAAVADAVSKRIKLKKQTDELMRLRAKCEAFENRQGKKS